MDPKQITARRLSGRVAVSFACQEAMSLPEEAWQTHFNSSYHDGGWKAVALREAEMSPIAIAPGEYPLECYRDSALLAACPNIAQLIASLPGPKRTARLMKLEPGSVIREHTDAGVSLNSGEARMHFPLHTDDDVFFYLDGQRVPMRAGECWYVDVSRPHRVTNKGKTPRIHLVVDCVVDDSLYNAIVQGDTGDAYPSAHDPAVAFERFRQAVFAHPELQVRLLASTSKEAFVADTVAAGLELGIEFGPEEVASAMNAGRRSWIEQWVA